MDNNYKLLQEIIPLYVAFSTVDNEYDFYKVNSVILKTMYNKYFCVDNPPQYSKQAMLGYLKDYLSSRENNIDSFKTVWTDILDDKYGITNFTFSNDELKYETLTKKYDELKTSISGVKKTFFGSKPIFHSDAKIDKQAREWYQEIVDFMEKNVSIPTNLANNTTPKNNTTPTNVQGGDTMIRDNKNDNRDYFNRIYPIYAVRTVTIQNNEFLLQTLRDKICQYIDQNEKKWKEILIMALNAYIDAGNFTDADDKTLQLWMDNVWSHNNIYDFDKNRKPVRYNMYSLRSNLSVKEAKQALNPEHREYFTSYNIEMTENNFIITTDKMDNVGMLFYFLNKINNYGFPNRGETTIYENKMIPLINILTNMKIVGKVFNKNGNEKAVVGSNGIQLLSQSGGKRNKKTRTRCRRGNNKKSRKQKK